MGVITSATTQATAIGWTPQTMIDRSAATGDLWAIAQTGASSFAVYRSTDGGASWSSNATFSRSNVSQMGEMRIDNVGDHIHWMYVTNESSQDRVYYKRIDIRTGTAAVGGDFLVKSASNGGVANSVYLQCATYPLKLSNGGYYILVPVAFRGTFSGVNTYAVQVQNESTGFYTTVNPGLILNKAGWSVSGDDSSFSVSVDQEHNGDGVGASTPNVWIVWQTFTTIYAVKMAWQGSSTGWSGPTSPTTILTSRSSSLRDAPCRWNGSILAIASRNTADTTKMDLIDRNKANTGQTFRTSPTHPQGVITAYTLTNNSSTGGTRVFAVGTSTAFTYYVDLDRGTNTWGSWTLAYATTAPRAGLFGARRGTYGDNTYDYYQQEGTVSPYTVRTVPLALTSATPTAPTWIVGGAGMVTLSGAAFDVSASLTLDWQFNSPVSTDTQGSYALSRQIGAGSVQYWRASDSTWQAAEVQNSSASSVLTLTTGQWLGGGGASDPAHIYKVKTWNASSVAGPYSAELAVLPSTRVDPTLAHPTASETFTVNQPTVTWTVSEQSAYRVTVTDNVTGVLIHDSGWLRDPGGASPSVLSYQIPVVLADGFSGTATLQSKNVEGLASVVRSNGFFVDYTEPATPTISALAAVASSGGINVTVTQPAAAGTQPSTTTLDLWRRKVQSLTVLNLNPYFETNVSDWTGNGCTVARSTAQFHQGVASMLVTPNGVAATPSAELASFPATTAGTYYEFRTWVRATTTNKPIVLYMLFLDASNALVNSAFQAFTPVAGTWIWINMLAAGQPTSTKLKVAVGPNQTPAAGDTIYVDQAEVLLGNTDAGFRINAGITSGATYLDWRAVSGQEYEYRGVAYGSNGTSKFGPWAAS